MSQQVGIKTIRLRLQSPSSGLKSQTGYCMTKSKSFKGKLYFQKFQAPILASFSNQAWKDGREEGWKEVGKEGGRRRQRLQSALKCNAFLVCAPLTSLPKGNECVSLAGF